MASTKMPSSFIGSGLPVVLDHVTLDGRCRPAKAIDVNWRFF